MQVAGVCEVADVGEKRAFANIDTADGFRNQPVQVRVTLSMNIGRQVDRYIVDEDGEIGAMIEIPTAQIILIGFAAVRMLDRHQPRCRFDDLAWTRDRPGVDIRA